MRKLATVMAATGIINLLSVASFAMPPGGNNFTPKTYVESARLVCDEFGRCTFFADGYGFSPPSKWERKGYCPPGQAKKGNC